MATGSRNLCVCVAASAALLSACDSSKAEVTPTGTPPARLDPVPQRMAAATDLWTTCCARLYRLDVDAGEWANGGGIDPYGRYAAGLPIEVQGHLAYDPALGADCVARLRAAAQSCALSEPESEAIDRACFVYRGTLPAGAGCTDSVECAPPGGGPAACLRGSPMTTAATGTCTVLERGTKGDLCDQFAEAGALHFCDPADGLFCGSSGACEQRRAQGAPCVASAAQPDVCADGLYCGQTAACVPRKTTGAACASHVECLSATCYLDVCADTRPVPSIESCSVLEAGVMPADAGPDGDASDGDASDGEEG